MNKSISEVKHDVQRFLESAILRLPTSGYSEAVLMPGQVEKSGMHTLLRTETGQTFMVEVRKC